MAGKRKSAPSPKRVAAIKSALSLTQQIAAGRSRLQNRMAGTMYSGRRDVYGAAGYIGQDEEKFADYFGMYERGDVAGRIVDMPAKTTWRTPPEVVEPKAAGGTKFTKAFTEMAERLKLWHYLGRIDRLSGIGRYGVLMLGVAGTDDQDLSQPLLKVRNAEDIIYLGVYHEDNAGIETWQKDPSNPRFGLPEVYNLKVVAKQWEKSFKDTIDMKVHHTRCIHVAEDKLQDDVFGRPRLKRVLNRLFDLDKIAASTGEAYWQLVSKILQAKIDPGADISAAELLELDEKLEEMVHDLRRQFTGQGVALEWLSASTPNPGQIMGFYFALIAGAAGIPKRILFGSELGELASSQDQATYLGSVNERQEQFAEPDILRPFIDRMIAIKALPAPQGGKYQIVWPTLFEETDVENAAANKDRALAAAALTPIGGDPRELVEVDEDRNIWLIPRTPTKPGAAETPVPVVDEVEPGVDAPAAV